MTTSAQDIARTILKQIKAADFWALGACGARQYVALDNGVQFRVTITSPRTHHKIRIHLNAMDTYDVERIKIKRGSYEVIIEESAEGIYADQLAGVVYRMCNK